VHLYNPISSTRYLTCRWSLDVLTSLPPELLNDSLPAYLFLSACAHPSCTTPTSFTVHTRGYPYRSALDTTRVKNVWTLPAPAPAPAPPIYRADIPPYHSPSLHHHCVTHPLPSLSTPPPPSRVFIKSSHIVVFSPGVSDRLPSLCNRPSPSPSLTLN
jgi:hypothetical protein